jgi:hypothetical protein
LPALLFPPDTTFTCIRDTLHLIAAGGSSYLWNSAALIYSAISDTAYFLAGTDFSGTIVVSDSNGCSYVSSYHLMHLPSTTVDLGPDTLLCHGDSIVLDAGVHQSYLWSGGAGTPTLKAGAGTWLVAVSDSGFCAATDTLIIAAQAALDVNLGPDTLVPFGYAIKLSPGPGFASYLWSTGETADTILATLSMTYSVTVSDTLGCMESDAVDVFFFGSLSKSENTPDALRIYPNPTLDNLEIEGDASAHQWQLIDVNGRIINSGRIAEYGRTTLQMGTLNAGLYTLLFPQSGKAFRIQKL